MIKIITIADIHYGKNTLTKRGDTALSLLDEFNLFVDKEKPDLIVDLGDRINDIDKKNDIILQKEIFKKLNENKIKTYHVCGNHDVVNLSISENEDIFNQSLENEVIHLNNYKIILWRADTKIYHTDNFRGFKVNEMDFIWLNTEVINSKVPVIIFSHVPISPASLIGNYYFQNNPSFGSYPNSSRVRNNLCKASMPVFFLSGHVHWNTFAQEDGITYLTQQSLTESFSNYGKPTKSWGQISLDNKFSWKVYGDEPIEISLDIKKRNIITPLGSFSNSNQDLRAK